MGGAPSGKNYAKGQGKEIRVRNIENTRETYERNYY